MTTRQQRLLLAIRLIFGVMFLVSGIAKSLDSLAFSLSVNVQYGFPLIFGMLAKLVPTFEVGLGLSMLFWPASRKTYTTVLGLMAIFTTAIIAGLFTGELESCGCFGPVLETSPATALARNFGLIGLAWYARRLAPEPVARTVQWRHYVIVGFMVVATAATVRSSRRPFLDSGPPTGSSIDLELGSLASDKAEERLIYIFHPGCPHCWNNVPRIETYAAAGVEVVGLIPEGVDPEELHKFESEVGPSFPFHVVPVEKIARLAPHGFPTAI